MFSVYSYFKKIVGIAATRLSIYIVEIMCVQSQLYRIGSNILTPTWMVRFRKNKRGSNIYRYIPRSWGGWCNEGGSWSKGCMIHSMWTCKETCCAKEKDDLVAWQAGRCLSGGCKFGRMCLYDVKYTWMYSVGITWQCNRGKYVNTYDAWNDSEVIYVDLCEWWVLCCRLFLLRII